MHNRHLACAFLLVALSTPVVAQSWSGGGDNLAIQQFDFWGFSITEPQQVGQELELVGVLVPATTWLPFPLNFTLNEYTVYIRDLVLSQRNQIGIAIESHYSGGYADIYEDPSFNAPFAYNTSPENVPPLDPAQVPANFMDGSLVASLEFRNLITIFYPSSGIGSIAYTASELRVVGGWALPKLRKEHMLIGWHMGGAYSDDPRYIPPGYGMRYDPLFRWENPLPVEPVTWGRIKSTFK